MKLHITITDKETGKVIHEADTNAIIGGYKTEGGSNSICVARCSDFDLSCAITTAREAISAIEKQKGPVFTAMTKMMPELLKATKEEESESEEEKSEEDSNE